MSKELNRILSIPQLPEYASVGEQIKEYIKNTYNANVRYCVFNSKDDKITGIYVLLETNKDYKTVERLSPQGQLVNSFVEDGKAYSAMLQQAGLAHTPRIGEGLFIFYRSFEYLALQECYFDSFAAFKAFREKYFNSDTMERIDNYHLFVVYKNEEMLNEAAEKGLLKKMTEEYYKLIKQFDKYDLITTDNKFLVSFDCSDHAPSQREYHDIALERLLAD